jgi:hypothetical protein
MKPFRIYRNLHKNCFSIQMYNNEKKGYRLHCHAQDVLLKNVKTFVSESGRQRTIKEKQKCVHAFIECESFVQFDDISYLLDNDMKELTYNPYKQDCFTVAGQPFTHAEQVILTSTPKPKALIFKK